MPIPLGGGLATPGIGLGGAGQELRCADAGHGACRGPHALCGRSREADGPRGTGSGAEKGTEPIEVYGAVLASGQECSANPPFARSTNPFLSVTSNLKLSKTSLMCWTRPRLRRLRLISSGLPPVSEEPCVEVPALVHAGPDVMAQVLMDGEANIGMACRL